MVGIADTNQVSVLTALPLRDDQIRLLSELLHKKTGKTIEISFAVDPTVLGGIRITLGDTMIDCTVKQKLVTMHSTLTKDLEDYVFETG